MIAMLAALPASAVKSIAPDRGSEFAKYYEVSGALPQTIFYFTPPHSRRLAEQADYKWLDAGMLVKI